VRKTSNQLVICEEQSELSSQRHATLRMTTEFLQVDKLPENESPSHVSALELYETADNSFDYRAVRGRWDEASLLPLMFAGLDEVLEDNCCESKYGQEFHDSVDGYLRPGLEPH